MSTQFGTPKRTLGTGDLVISVSEIFDKLQSKVDPNTLEQLLRDILAGRRPQVRPGELITAELINQILAELESLELRLAKVEATCCGPTETEPDIVITDWQPHDKVQLRHRLDVTGENFPTSLNEGSVDVGGRAVTLFLAVSATALSFEIPPTVTPGNNLMTIRKGTRSASATIKVVEEDVIPKGELFVNDVTPAGGKFEANKPFTFVFELDSQTIPDEDYTLAVNFSDVTGSTATIQTWKNNTKLQLVSGSPVPSPVRLGPNQKLRVNAIVTIPAASSANMALQVSSVNAPADAKLNKSSGAIKIVAGAAPQANDPRTTFTIGTIGAALPARKATIDGLQGVEIVYAASPTFPVNANFVKAGVYEFKAELENADPTNWNVVSVTPTGFTSGANGNQPISVKLNLKKAAAAAGGAHPEKNFLIVTARRTNADETFSSFIRMPIQGFTRTT
jgi:hypothetical protein